MPGKIFSLPTKAKLKTFATAATLGLTLSAFAQVNRLSIPDISPIYRIKVVYTTMPELEKFLGPGKTIIGGHPNGARLWRVKGTSWTVYADAFEWSKRGMVVDSFSIYEDVAPEPDIPFARISPKRLRWLHEIHPGTKQEQLKQALKLKAL